MPGQRQPLSREAILRTAVAFADEHGLNALTMRRLGEVLGVEAMSLYYHVNGREDLLEGMVVEIVSGMSALALALVLGPRIGFKKDAMRPHNLPFVLLGAGLLWFGWFGFNAGSAVGASGLAGYAMVNTIVATCAAMLAWLLVERIRDGKATSLGAASGVVAGLVAITPACSSVSPMGAIAVGAIASALCALAVGLKFRFGYDDSLDVVGVHLVGGLAGTVLIGFFADPGSGAAVAGLFYGGGVDQLWRQIVGAVAVLLYSGILTFVIALIVKAVFGGRIRISPEDEATGIDETEHAETGYDFSSHRSTISGLGSPRPSAATPQAAEHVPATAGKEG